MIFTDEMIHKLRSNNKLSSKRLCNLFSTYIEDIMLNAYANGIVLENVKVDKSIMDIGTIITIKDMIERYPDMLYMDIYKMFTNVSKYSIRRYLTYLGKCNIKNIRTKSCANGKRMNDADANYIYDNINKMDPADIGEHIGVSKEFILTYCRCNNIEIKYRTTNSICNALLSDVDRVFIDSNYKDMSVNAIIRTIGKSYNAIREYYKECKYKMITDRMTVNNACIIFAMYANDVRDGKMTLVDVSIATGVLPTALFIAKKRMNMHKDREAKNLRVDKKLLHKTVKGFKGRLTNDYQLFRLTIGLDMQYVEYLACKGFLRKEHQLNIDNNIIKAPDGCVYLKKGCNYSEYLDKILKG